MEQSKLVLPPIPVDDAAAVPSVEQPQARRLTTFAQTARQRLRRNVASRPRLPESTAPPLPDEAKGFSAADGRRAEAALLISAILEFRPDLDDQLSISAGAETVLEPDLLVQIDCIAAQRGEVADDRSRRAIINAIVRDWLTARERLFETPLR